MSFIDGTNGIGNEIKGITMPKLLTIKEGADTNESIMAKYLEIQGIEQKSDAVYSEIEAEKSDSEDDSGDVSKLRGTISYNQSKLKKEKDSQKIVNIYEVLRKSVK